jgi:hypothetical protein
MSAERREKGEELTNERRKEKQRKKGKRGLERKEEMRVREMKGKH